MLSLNLFILLINLCNTLLICLQINYALLHRNEIEDDLLVLYLLPCEHYNKYYPLHSTIVGFVYNADADKKENPVP